jgi:hypothetical protein
MAVGGHHCHTVTNILSFSHQISTDQEDSAMRLASSTKPKEKQMTKETKQEKQNGEL